MEFELVEPLRLLFKDEVRKTARNWTAGRDCMAAAFSGAGFQGAYFREVTREKLAILAEADAIVTGELQKAGFDREVWQYFAVLPSMRSVGVMGDERTYAYPIIVRAVTSDDAMTADWARLPYELLDRISRRIVNEVPGINRVVYDITSKPRAR